MFAGGRLEEALEHYRRSKEYGVDRAAMHIRNVSRVPSITELEFFPSASNRPHVMGTFTTGQREDTWSEAQGGAGCREQTGLSLSQGFCRVLTVSTLHHAIVFPSLLIIYHLAASAHLYMLTPTLCASCFKRKPTLLLAVCAQTTPMNVDREAHREHRQGKTLTAAFSLHRQWIIC